MQKRSKGRSLSRFMCCWEANASCSREVRKSEEEESRRRRRRRRNRQTKGIAFFSLFPHSLSRVYLSTFRPFKTFDGSRHTYLSAQAGERGSRSNGSTRVERGRDDVALPRRPAAIDSSSRCRRRRRRRCSCCSCKADDAAAAAPSSSSSSRDSWSHLWRGREAVASFEACSRQGKKKERKDYSFSKFFFFFFL